MAVASFRIKTKTSEIKMPVYDGLNSLNKIGEALCGGRSYNVYNDYSSNLTRYCILFHGGPSNLGYVKAEYFEDTPEKFYVVPANVNKVDTETVTDEDGNTVDQVSMTVNELYSYLSTADNDLNVYNLTSMDGIYGAPYQFMDIVDRPVDGVLSPNTADTNNSSSNKKDGSMLGRKYSERIVTRMPLLFLSPGRINFMPTYKKNQKAGVINYLVSGGENKDVLTDILNGKSGRYYTFEYDFATYYQYVNTMLRSGATFLGIGDVKLPKRTIGGSISWERLDSYNWENDTNSSFGFSKIGFATGKEYIPFFMDSASSISESFSNDTTQSQLSSTVNSFADTARELGFILGAGAGVEYGMYKNDDEIKSSIETIDSISKKYVSGSKFLKDLAGNMSVVASGGKLLFPEIWSDSQFSKSYDINFKLRTPDGDKLSWFLNIYVPLAHLICMTAPKQHEDTVNGYIQPFMVRASYKGMFNIPLGMIGQLSITKGRDKAWTIDGLPTEVDVSMEIRDLYNLLTISNEFDGANGIKMTAQNTCYMDYIANSCGVNINLPDIERSAKMYLMLIKNRITDIPNNIWNAVQQGFSNKLMNIYDNFLGL